MGSKGGGSGSSSNSMSFQNTTSSYTPNPEAMAAYRRSLSMAENATSAPYEPYGGAMTAGFTPDQMAAFQGVRNMQGMVQPYINSATKLTNQALGYSDPRNFNAQSLDQYQNPYNQQVTDATMANLKQLNADQDLQARSRAATQGTFGGSGEFRGRAEIARQQNLANAQTLAGLHQQGYQSAVQQYNQQQQQAIQTAQNSAYGLGQLGSQAQQAALQGIQALMGTGGQQQQLEQQQLTGAYNQWLQAKAYPYQQAAFFSGIAAGIAPNMGGTTNTSGFGMNMGNQQQSGGGGGGGGGMSGLSSIMSMLPMMFSDKDDKTDIKYLGEDESGEKMYAYRYKGDPKSYPKVVGPMAQDIEEQSPESVHEIGGHKVVEGLGHLAPSEREHFDAGGGAGPGAGSGATGGVGNNALGALAGTNPAIGGPSGSIYAPSTSPSTANVGFGVDSNAGSGAANAQAMDPGMQSFLQNAFDPRTADQMARAKWVNQPQSESEPSFKGDNFTIPPQLMQDGGETYPYHAGYMEPHAEGGRVGRAAGGGGLGSFMDLVKQGGASGPYANAPDNIMADAQQMGIGKIIPQGTDKAKSITESAASSMMSQLKQDTKAGGSGGGGSGGGGGGAPKMPDMKGAKGAGQKPTEAPFKDPGAGGAPEQAPGGADSTSPQPSATGTPQAAPAGVPEVSAANQQAGQGGFDFAQAAPPIESSPVVDQMNAPAPEMAAPAAIPEIPLLGFGFAQGGRIHKDGGGAAGGPAAGGSFGGGGLGALGQGGGIGDIVLGDATSPGAAAGLGDLMAGQEKLSGEGLMNKWTKQYWARDPGEQKSPVEQGMPAMPDASFYTKPREDLPSVNETKHYGEQNPGLDTNAMGAMAMFGGKGFMPMAMGALGTAQTRAAQDQAAAATRAELTAKRESMLKDPANYPVQGYYTTIDSTPKGHPEMGMQINPRTGLYNLGYTGAYRGMPFKDGGRVGMAEGGTPRFYDKVYGALLEAAKAHHAPHPEALARLGAAQSMVETGGGKHAPGNNFFGIKGPGGSYATKEVVNGKTVGTTASFRGYPSMQDSANDYVKLMATKPRYRDVFNADTPAKAIAAQSHSGYATDPKYGAKLASADSRAGNSPVSSPGETQYAQNSSRAVPYDPSKPSLAYNVMPQRPVPMAKPDPGFSPAASQPKPTETAAAVPASKYPGSALNRINPADPSGPLLGAPSSSVAAKTPAPFVSDKPKTGFFDKLAHEFSPVSSAKAGERGVYPKEDSVASVETKSPGVIPSIDKGPAAGGGDHPKWNPNASTPAQDGEGIPRVDHGEAGPSGARPGWHDPQYTYAPGVQEQAGIMTGFGESARHGDMLGDTPYAVTMVGAPMGPWGGDDAGFTEKAAGAPESAAATKDVPAAAPAEAASAASGQKYWGDWRDAEPWKSDPIGGFFDQLGGDAPRADRPGTWSPGQSAGFDLGNLFGGDASPMPKAAGVAAPSPAPAAAAVSAPDLTGMPTEHVKPGMIVPEQAGPPMPEAMEQEAHDDAMKHMVMEAPEAPQTDAPLDLGGLTDGMKRGGMVRKHFGDGGEAELDPLGALGQGFAGIGEGVGDFVSSLGQGFGNLMEGSPQAAESASASAAPQAAQGADFYTRWSENPLSQFIYHAGQALDHPHANPLDAVGTGMRGAMIANHAGSERSALAAKQAEASAYQDKLNAATSGEGVEPESTGVEDDAAMPAASAQPHRTAAPAAAPAGDSRLNELYERYDRIASMPAVGSQISQKKAALDIVAHQIQLWEKREAANKGELGTATDEWGNQTTYWKSGPKQGQPFKLESAPSASDGAASPSGDGATPGQTNWSKSGDEFLQSLPSQVQEEVRGIAEGRLALPPGKYGQTLWRAVTHYKPGFDMTMYTARKKMQTDYADNSGTKPGAQITAGNTAIGHAGELSDLILKLKNYDVDILNKPINWVKEHYGGEAAENLNKYRSLVDKYVDEQTSFYKGRGGGSVDERREARERLDPNKAPKVLLETLRGDQEAMGSKISELEENWHRTMGKDQTMPIDDYGVISKHGKEGQALLQHNMKVARGEATPVRTGHTKSGQRVTQYSDGYIKYGE